MKCVIGGPQLRVFGRAIHAMARISDEFWFDPVETGHYCWTAAPEPCQKEKQLSLPCKLVIKSVLPVFRCANVQERNVEKCSISSSPREQHLTFQLLCKHGVVKTYNLTFQECDPLQAVFAKHLCPNVLKVHSRLLAEVMVHFPTSQEEITLSVTPVRVCFKSYTEEDTDFSRTMITEIHLSPEEFDYFQVGVDSEVTFCLKELRGLLAFSEATGVPVSIHFDRCGKPIAFSLEDVLLESSFILATLCEPERETPAQELQHSSKAHVDKSCDSCLDEPNTDSAKPASPLGKQGAKRIPGAGERDGTEGAGAATAGAAAGEAAQKFHSLFFGAVSSKEKEALAPTFQSLATASDSEDLGSLQSSQGL